MRRRAGGHGWCTARAIRSDQGHALPCGQEEFQARQHRGTGPQVRERDVAKTPRLGQDRGKRAFAAGRCPPLRQLQEPEQVLYAMALGLMLVVAGLLYLVFRRRGWL
jgi:hypothetical protein